MSSPLTKLSSSSSIGCPGYSLNQSTVAFLPEKSDKAKSSSRINYRVVKIVLAALPIFLLLTLVIVLLILLTRSKPDLPMKNGIQFTKCNYSDEAKLVGLDSFLDELVRKYFELVPEKLGSKPGVTVEEIHRNFRPYDPRPSAIKNFTDGVRSLHETLEVIIGKANGSLLKLRENKAMYVAQQLLRHSVFGGPYNRDYYAGDWMFEPNMYCWQPICGVLSNLNEVIFYFMPGNLSGIEAIEQLLKKHNETFSQYIENLKLGVATGMVRSKESCTAGIIAIKRNYYDIAEKKEFGIFNTDLGKTILRKSFTKKITSKMNDTWYKTRGEGVHESLKRFLLVYLGEPLNRLIREVHGMVNLPLPFVYVNGVRDPSQPTTGRLPNGEPINISYSYVKLLSFFTSGKISPMELKKMGHQKLKALLDQAKELAKQYTGIEDVNSAVSQFRSILESRDMFFNDVAFPANESGDEAFMRCANAKGASVFCPVRWKTLQKWIDSTKQTASFLKPKIKPLFYDAPPNKTTASCGISARGEYNPTVCFHGYVENLGCKVSAYQTLPFFMDNFGPKYTEYTTTAHEQSPGHHLEVQGYAENFADDCDDIISWISSPNYLPSFTEGWATYVENPLMVEETDVYANLQDKNVLLQKYGMLKYQILAALRSVLDTSVNYFKMTRERAKQLYDEYAWDRGDLASKDITRYQSAPATVTSYMIGRETFVQLKKQAERELGSDFSIKEFHYQLLRQGEIPLTYMKMHIARFIECKKDSSKPGCKEILSSH
ncbi:hypothetical protein P5673_003897 [Acropora cervicornis]|uniref:DUF885 domain-containing protein n=1 Tax=Acropora cervicornis TaxID=6130 RepID=A0AAD9R1J0_ACRCE|nr:hypothetical protein P5673_003897 [Acropora cervicornis]